MTINHEDLNLDALEATARAATPGPWGLHLGAAWQVVTDAPDWGQREVATTGTADSIGSEDDAAHIATFDPPTVLALIAELRRSREDLEYFRSLPHVSVYTKLTEERDAARARLREAEAVIEEEMTRHREKRGESARYADDDFEQLQPPTHFEPYVICDACGTHWPCRTARTLSAHKPTNQDGGQSPVQ